MTTHPHRSQSGVYRIYATTYYYAGTLNAPRGGPVLDENSGEPLEFDSRAEARRHLTAGGRSETTGYAMDCEQCSGGVYSPRGTYYLSHGEYAAPTYKIRKVRHVRAHA